MDIILETSPDIYKIYVTTDCKKVKQLVVQCQNAIYGTMMESLLYYQKFRNTLELKGYEFNPYSPCVANIIIKNKQMKICFHVDDCKLIHRSPKVVEKII